MIGSPEQNGIKERFYGSLKDDEVWPKEYDTRAEAIDQIDAWIGFYRTERPHQALGYLTPAEFRASVVRTRARIQRRPKVGSRDEAGERVTTLATAV
ncbi:MAG: integrase core domain-containing protein [Actinomycetota bacterium]|jgi:putative transposase|nr:integrase core domain-containing protein [Actinomycetota bacterium]